MTCSNQNCHEPVRTQVEIIAEIRRTERLSVSGFHRAITELLQARSMKRTRREIGGECELCASEINDALPMEEVN